jgi:hypothetical protein
VRNLSILSKLEQTFENEKQAYEENKFKCADEILEVIDEKRPTDL